MGRSLRRSTRVLLLFVCLSFRCLQLGLVSSSSTFGTNQGYRASSTARTLRQDQNGSHEVHCSRERSRAAWKIIQEYLMPFVEKEQYEISKRCRLHPDNDIYRDQEQHKIQVNYNEWQCGYCRKRFYDEKYLDNHFDNRHYNLLNVNGSKCLADLCGALHCDVVMDSVRHKSKCNPAAAARNQHLCESLADGCFPVNEGKTANRLHEFFLRQFCDAHTCNRGHKPFSRGRKRRTNIFYVSVSVLTLVLLTIFYITIYMYKRGMKRPMPTLNLRRISHGRTKKKNY